MFGLFFRLCRLDGFLFVSWNSCLCPLECLDYRCVPPLQVNSFSGQVFLELIILLPLPSWMLEFWVFPITAGTVAFKYHDHVVQYHGLLWFMFVVSDYHASLFTLSNSAFRASWFEWQNTWSSLLFQPWCCSLHSSQTGLCCVFTMLALLSTQDFVPLWWCIFLLSLNLFLMPYYQKSLFCLFCVKYCHPFLYTYFFTRQSSNKIIY